MLSDITIVIPTFHRRGYLRACLDGIKANLPECPVRIAQDDGGDCTLEVSDYETYYWAKLPYDSGLTAKRNAAVRLVETKYTLMGCDDFDFTDPEAREGIELMVKILDDFDDIDVVAGRVNNRPYEGLLEHVPGECIREYPIDDFILPFMLTESLVMWKIDIAANYFLARTSVLRRFPWDEDIRPIGGEHVDWFLDLKDAGMKVVFPSPYANINTQPYDPAKQNPRYKEFRRRALTTGHALMKQKRNIKQYIDFNGGIS
jgi:hypothetical protein